MPRVNVAGARLRCRRACDSCKRRKQKCNGEQPCTICVQRHKESECRFSDKPARFLRPSAARRAVDLCGYVPSSCQDQAVVGRLLSPFGSHSASVEPQARDDRDGEAPVPKVSRLLRDGQGRLTYIGDSASLSFLQSVRRIVSASIGCCEFTDDGSRHSMLEAFQSNPKITLSAAVPPPQNEEAQYLARQYVLATSPLLDLFDLEEFYLRLSSWIENPSGDEDIVSSVFYLILAIGSQVASTNETLAERYFASGRQLALSAFTETPSVYTIQSYMLISMYMLGACRRNGAFMSLGVAVRAAYAVGVHKEGANMLFFAREKRTRERVWKSLRTMDLFLSASLGRPPAISDFDYDAYATMPSQDDCQPHDHVSCAVTTLCRIFERILTDVYRKQVISISVAETISSQHREWVRNLPETLKHRAEAPGLKPLEDILPSVHVLSSYYWSIILLTRPFLIYRVSQYVKSKGRAADCSEPQTKSSRIAVFADACVYSALRALDTVSDLSQCTSLPRRLPFLVNSVFISAIVLGAAFFADYDSLLPLEEGMNKADKFLELFIPHDPQSCRFFQIVKYLRASISEYVNRRNRQWMENRSKHVDQLFGQVSHDCSAASSSATPDGITFAASAQALGPLAAVSADLVSTVPLSQASPVTVPQNPATANNNSSNSIWDTLCTDSNHDGISSTVSHDAAISALTTTGIPIDYSPGGTMPSLHSIQRQQASLPNISLDTTLTTCDGAQLSEILFSENGLLFMAEDMQGLGLWGEV